MPKVSVIVPVYNVKLYLRIALDSLIRQTLHDIEIICINDGSTDGSGNILHEYAEKDSRVIVIDQKNGGYGKAMNTGIDHATGEYIGILEPDDFVALTMYEDLYEIAKTNDLDILKADFYRFTIDQETETESYQYAHLSGNQDSYGTVFRPMDRLESFFYIMNTWSGIYRHSFLREKGIKHHETPGASFQDNGFWFQTFLYADRAMIVDTPYYRVRRDNPNSSIRNPEKVYAANIEYDFIRGIIMKDKAAWEKLKGVYWRKRYHNYNATLRRVDQAYIYEYTKQIARELNRGYSRGEFSEKDFPKVEWLQIVAMMEERPELGTPAELFLKGELELIRNSKSYRLGRMITSIPRKIRGIIRRVTA